MEKYLYIKSLFEENEDKENAFYMKKYMRNLFPFYGISSAKRKMIYRDFLKSEKKNKAIDWDVLDKCYEDEHREFQYLVSDYLIALNYFLKYEDLKKIKIYVQKKSWWDTIDFLCRPIGELGLVDSRADQLMIEWSTDEDIWVRRTAIEYQLSRKEKTNSELLEKIIINNFGTDEFFINKAIGWSLREFSKVNPDWVRNFMNKYNNQMSNLSIREGSKYI